MINLHDIRPKYTDEELYIIWFYTTYAGNDKYYKVRYRNGKIQIQYYVVNKTWEDVTWRKSDKDTIGSMWISAGRPNESAKLEV